MLSGESSHWAGLKAHDPALIKFMEDDCDFDCEVNRTPFWILLYPDSPSVVQHADGSFLDHLQFCYEYCHVHFPAASPTVCFLHSIMGVGTNLFPMKLEQRPELAKLVNPDELAHIEAFPTMLRVLQASRTLMPIHALASPRLSIYP